MGDEVEVYGIICGALWEKRWWFMGLVVVYGIILCSFMGVGGGLWDVFCDPS